MLNKVSLIGRVGKYPDTRKFEDGTSLTNITLATSESYKDKQGNKAEKTEWHNIVMYRGLSDVTEKYVKKGNLLYIEGKIRTRQYEKDGEKRSITEIVADNMLMLPSNNAKSTGSSETINEPEGDGLPF